MGDGQLTFVFLRKNDSIPISQGKHLHSLCSQITSMTTHPINKEPESKGKKKKTTGVAEKQLHVNL